MSALPLCAMAMETYKKELKVPINSQNITTHLNNVSYISMFINSTEFILKLNVPQVAKGLRTPDIYCIILNCCLVFNQFVLHCTLCCSLIAKCLAFFASIFSPYPMEQKQKPHCKKQICDNFAIIYFFKPEISHCHKYSDPKLSTYLKHLWQ